MFNHNQSYCQVCLWACTYFFCLCNMHLWYVDTCLCIHVTVCVCVSVIWIVGETACLLLIQHSVIFPVYSTDWKLSCQHKSTRGVCSSFGWVFSSLKWVFIYSHQWAIGAFQQRWWQDIKQIVCNEVIIKHNPVVSHTDLSLWHKKTNKKNKYTHIPTHHSPVIYSYDTS